jgi:hypothetical protein
MNDLTYNVKIRRIMTGGFEVGNCLKQGDGLAPSHFDIAMEYAKRQLSVEQKYNTFHKSARRHKHNGKKKAFSEVRI